MAQLVRKRGGETLVNTLTAGLQSWPAVASFADGSFVTVWNDGQGSDGSGWGVKAQLFDPAGAKVGGELTINQLVQGNQLEPTVAVLGDGDFVVTWMAPGYRIEARRFSSSGDAVGDDFQVNASTAGEPTPPRIFALAGGGFAVAWLDIGEYLVADQRIRVQMFTAEGARGPELVMGSIGSVGEVEGVSLASGNFMVLWGHTTQANGTYTHTLRGQMFDPTGAAIGEEIPIAPAYAGSPEIEALPNGGFVAVWNGYDTASRAMAQLFDATGAQVGGIIAVGEGVYEPKVTALSWGGFILAWQESLPLGYTALKGRLFDAGGNLLGPEFQINSATAESGGANLELATLAGDVVVALWRNEEGGAGERIGVKMQMLTTPNLVGTSADDILSGGAGDDAIVGLAGADQMAGGLGNDSYHVDDAGDQVIELAGEGLDGVTTALADYSLPDHVEDLAGTGVTGQVLRGNSLNNVLTGGPGGDSLHLGGAGDDIAKGGAGDDLLVIDWGDSAAAFVTTSKPTVDFVAGRYQGLTGAFEAGSGRSVAFTGIDRLHIFAGSADDTLAGTDGDDIVDGGSGDDILIGGFGTDVLAGGSGIDTIDYSNPVWEGLVVNLGDGPVAGEDGTLVPGHSVWDSYSVFDTITGIENVRTGSWWDIVYGDAAVNRIETGPGLDFLQGGGGADVLVGGTGNDVYSILAADDSIFDDTIVELAGGGTDEVVTDLATFSLAGIAQVEDLTGTSAGGQMLTGNELNNVLSGAGGADTLEGAAGQDWLRGGGGTDTLRGGIGNDFYEVDEEGDVVVESAGEGTDTVRTALATYSLAALAHVENLTATSSSAHRFRGNGGDNVLTGGAGNDVLLLHDGGEDSGRGGDGNDVIYIGSALSAGDVANGGSGRDAIVFQGNVAAVLSNSNLVGIESISIQSGANSFFGDTANNFYDYDVTTADGNVAAGQQMIVNAQSLRSGEDLIFDGSAETDGRFLVYGGHGVDLLTGGAGADVFFFEGQRWSSSDKVDGGAGRDSMVISAGSGLNHIEFEVDSFTGIESISLNNLFASDPTQKPSYELVLDNGNVAPGGTLIVNGSSIPLGQVVNVDGSAVQGGNLILFAGGGHDVLTGGAGADLIFGGGGADAVTGGAGADTFRYDSTTDSSPGLPDLIGDFQTGTDKIDLTRIDANTFADGNQAFTWIGANAFSGAGAASAGELRLYEQGGYQRIEGDTNGDGDADLVIVLQVGTVPLVQGDFLL